MKLILQISKSFSKPGKKNVKNGMFFL